MSTRGVSDESTPGTARRGWSGRLIGVVLAIGGTVAVTAWAQHGPGDMGPPMHGGPGGAMMFGGGSPEQAGRMADRFLDGLKATDAQRAQIRQIVQAAAADIQAQRKGERSLHQKALAVFTAPTVDASAAESLRAQMQAEHEQSSRRMLQAMLDVSRVLTPEQRAKIGARMQEHADMMEDRMQRMRMEHDHGGPHPDGDHADHPHS